LSAAPNILLKEVIMTTASAAPLSHGALEALIVRALVRKLVGKGVLSSDDVRSLLIEAAEHLDVVVGSDLTVDAAKSMVRGDLASFLGSPS